MSKILRIASVFGILLCLGLSGCGKDQPAPGAAEGDYGVNRPPTAEEQQAMDTITNARIYFGYDRFDITPESRATLTTKADVLKRFPQIRVVIEGHCDERGTEEYNLALGERRARVTYEYLTMLGVNPGQLEMVSYGKMHPAVEGHNESAWAQNRRCEFKVGFIR